MDDYTIATIGCQAKNTLKAHVFRALRTFLSKKVVFFVLYQNLVTSILGLFFPLAKVVLVIRGRIFYMTRNAKIALYGLFRIGLFFWLFRFWVN